MGDAGPTHAQLVAEADQAETEERLHRRRVRRRLRVLAGVAAIVLVAGAVLGYRWWRAPDLSVGSHHTVTMVRDSGTESCGANPEVWSWFTYGGQPWMPLDWFPSSWGTTGPWKGTLTITGPIPKTAPEQVTANGTFTHDGTTIQVYGGPNHGRGTPIC